MSLGDPIGLGGQKESQNPADAFIEAIAERVAEKVLQQLAKLTAPEGETWFTVREAAEYIKRDYYEVHRMIQSGEIPAHRAGPRTIRLHRRELDNWLLSQ
jgi:excisionase family DNA binding protein